MYAKDFEYDGHWLSDYGCIICAFDGSSGVQTAAVGSNISFEKASRNFGNKFSLVGVKYSDCYTTSFDICKDPDGISNDDMYFTSDECRDIMRWLNRKEFLKFRVLYDDEDIDTFYFNVSFNIEKIKIAEKVCGFRLKMESDMPYAYGEKEKFSITTSRTTTERVNLIKNTSDDIGDIYVDMDIVCSRSGDITIVNLTTGTSTYIRNCSMGEKIHIDGQNMSISTSSSRNIYDDFNYVFPKITNSLDNRINRFQISLPSEIELTYTPIIKEIP